MGYTHPVFRDDADRLAKQIAADLRHSGNAPTSDNVQRWAEGRKHAAANLSDASHKRLVTRVQREYKAQEQEEKDLAPFKDKR